jgi:hypothetical protein
MCYVVVQSGARERENQSGRRLASFVILFGAKNNRPSGGWWERMGGFVLSSWADLGIMSTCVHAGMVLAGATLMRSVSTLSRARMDDKCRRLLDNRSFFGRPCLTRSARYACCPDKV